MIMNDNIRYCRYCGKQIDADSTFCTHCGKSVDYRELSESLKLSFWTRIREILLLPLRFLKNISACIFSYKPSSERAGKFKQILFKVLKVIGILVLVAGIICGALAGYTYYTEVYIPEKLLDEAVADITNKFESTNDSIKLRCTREILKSDTKFGYENVSDDAIRMRLCGMQEKAFKYIESQAYAGKPIYQYELGQIYYFVSNYKNENKAIYWWNEAASQGYTKAYNNVGIAYKIGIGVDVNYRKAVEWIKRGAEAGEDLAQRNFGDLFMEGVRIKIGSHKERYTSPTYEVSDYIKYYHNGDRYVYLYEKDVDDYELLIPRDIEVAKFWWKKAASQGNEVAKERLQKVYN